VEDPIRSYIESTVMGASPVPETDALSAVRSGVNAAADGGLPENYRPATSPDVPEGRACGNCAFFDESDLDAEGRAFCTRWGDYAEGGAYCDAWEPAGGVA
jgi:hypothetical protein